MNSRPEIVTNKYTFEKGDVKTIDTLDTHRCSANNRNVRRKVKAISDVSENDKNERMKIPPLTYIERVKMKKMTKDKLDALMEFDDSEYLREKTLLLNTLKRTSGKQITLSQLFNSM